MICKPTEKDTRLSDSKRKIIYSCVTLLLFCLFSADFLYRYFGEQYVECQSAPYFAAEYNPHWEYRAFAVSLFLFTFLPAACSFVLYVKILSQLMIAKSKKIGRNLNLSMAFAVGWLFWIFASCVKVKH